MSLVRNRRFLNCVSNWVSHQVSLETLFKPQSSRNPRSFTTRRTANTQLSGEKQPVRPRNEIRKMVQLAMFDYLYDNRGLQFLIAESMSKNAPVFNDNLLKKLNGIKMEAYEIGKVFCCHSWWLGVSRLKQTSTFLNTLKGGKRRLCQVIQDNPEEMKKWTMGLRVQPLPGTGVDLVDSKAMKIQFLLDLGYKQNSKEMEKALKCFRGRGSELRERFNFLMSLGLNEREAKDMVKKSPDVLTQASDVLETKVNYLVNELGYSILTLVAFPSCLKYTLDRMKLRFAMFYWLQDRGKADANLAISSILVYSDKSFVTRFVNRHPDGPKHFEELKKAATL